MTLNNSKLQRLTQQQITRRHLFGGCAMGLGSIALSSIDARSAIGAGAFTESNAAQASALFGEGKERDFFVHGWWSFPVGDVREQTAVDQIERQTHSRKVLSRESDLHS